MKSRNPYSPEWMEQIRRRASRWLFWAIEEFGDTIHELLRQRDIYDLGTGSRWRNIRDILLYGITMAISIGLGMFGPKLPIPVPIGPDVLPKWALEVVIIVVIYIGFRLIAQRMSHPDLVAEDKQRNLFVIPALFWAGIIGVILVRVLSHWFPLLWCNIGVIVLYLIPFISGLMGMPMKRAQRNAARHRLK